MLAVWLLAGTHDGFVGNCLWTVDNVAQIRRCIRMSSTLHSYEYVELSYSVFTMRLSLYSKNLMVVVIDAGRQMQLPPQMIRPRAKR